MRIHSRQSNHPLPKEVLTLQERQETGVIQNSR